jgi:hypothetical protein
LLTRFAAKSQELPGQFVLPRHFPRANDGSIGGCTVGSVAALKKGIILTGGDSLVYEHAFDEGSCHDADRHPDQEVFTEGRVASGLLPRSL